MVNGQWQSGVFPADKPRPDVDAIWNGLTDRHIGLTADHSFIGCASSTVT